MGGEPRDGDGRASRQQIFSRSDLTHRCHLQLPTTKSITKRSEGHHDRAAPTGGGPPPSCGGGSPSPPWRRAPPPPSSPPSPPCGRGAGAAPCCRRCGTGGSSPRCAAPCRPAAGTGPSSSCRENGWGLGWGGWQAHDRVGLVGQGHSGDEAKGEHYKWTRPVNPRRCRQVVHVVAVSLRGVSREDGECEAAVGLHVWQRKKRAALGVAGG